MGGGLEHLRKEDKKRINGLIEDEFERIERRISLILDTTCPVWRSQKLKTARSRRSKRRAGLHMPVVVRGIPLGIASRAIGQTTNGGLLKNTALL